MRHPFLTLTPLASLAMLSACGGEQSAEERAAAERNVTSEVVQTNDVTAIDAATGEDAAMAADMPLVPEIDDFGDNNAAQADSGREDRPAARERTRPRPAAPRPSAPEDDEPEEPETNAL